MTLVKFMMRYEQNGTDEIYSLRQRMIANSTNSIANNFILLFTTCTIFVLIG